MTLPVDGEGLARAHSTTLVSRTWNLAPSRHPDISVPFTRIQAPWVGMS